VSFIKFVLTGEDVCVLDDENVVERVFVIDFYE
jgi:hypothetical protein